MSQANLKFNSDIQALTKKNKESSEIIYSKLYIRNLLKTNLKSKT